MMALIQETRIYHCAECDQCHRLAPWCETKERAKEVAILDDNFVFLTYPDSTEVVLCSNCGDTVRSKALDYKTRTNNEDAGEFATTLRELRVVRVSEMEKDCPAGYLYYRHVPIHTEMDWVPVHTRNDIFRREEENE